jgi:dephospho-CoA kinase
MILGVTGGIATGKSSVAAMFGELGATVVSADELARLAVVPGSPALEALVDRFGRDILAADGTLDRAALADIVFADPEARLELNRITHPAIARLAVERLAELRAAGHALIVYEAPLLFEAGAESRVDKVLVVTASLEIQLQRLMEREAIDADEARARIDAQMPLAEKIRRADFLVDNAGSPNDTRRQVETLYDDLLQFNSH